MRQPRPAWRRASLAATPLRQALNALGDTLLYTSVDSEAGQYVLCAIDATKAALRIEAWTHTDTKRTADEPRKPVGGSIEDRHCAIEPSTPTT